MPQSGRAVAPHLDFLIMRTRRLVLSLMLLACGFASGLVLTGRLRDTTDARAQTPQPAPPTPAAPASGAPAIAGLAAVALPDFSSVAERTVPGVANISSTQVVRRPNSPFSNDPFQYFFGDQ